MIEDERKKVEDQARAKREEEQRKAQEAQQKQQLAQYREKCKAELTEEPKSGAGEAIIEVAFRLPSGTKLKRNFRQSEPVKVL